MSDDQLENDLRRVWHDVQRLLLSTESCLNEPASVMISDCNVYAVFPDSKQIQKMTVEFTANCFVDNAQVDVGFEAGNLVIRFPGKNALAPRYAMDGLFHLSATDDRVLFVPTGYNNVGLDPRCTIRVETTNRDWCDQYACRQKMYLEFQRPNP
jgi:hypothetical protein